MEYIYSKPSGDITLESQSILEQETALQKIVSETTALLKNYPDRTRCILCDSHLSTSDAFYHRGIDFKHCNTCGHIQTKALPDDKYDDKVSQVLGYKEIYPELDMDSYKKRCARVYSPKAEWIHQSLEKDMADPRDLSWCDIGCGTGSFLYSLKELGYSNLYGIDKDDHNLRIAREVLGGNLVSKNVGSFSEAIRSKKADIYSAFFVLEHVADTADVIHTLQDLPKKTYFAFSVPTFSFITLFESILKNHYPRNLDGMMHTQIYTEESINFFLQRAGLEKKSEWIFGQDAIDMHRFLSVNLKTLYPPRLYRNALEKLSKLIDPLQNAIDRAHFADARHILAVKR